MEKITREQIQQRALETFKKTVTQRGTICLSTGTGKSKIAIDYIKENKKISKVLITSPRTNLKENWVKELEKWGVKQYIKTSLFIVAGRMLEITIENIQTTYKWDKETLSGFDFIVADEIHTMMSPEYSSMFQNSLDVPTMGLTATHDMTNKNDKFIYYKKYCPIIFEYYESAEDGLINKTRFKIVNHQLSNNDRILVRTKTKAWEQGELEHYEYLTTRIKNGQKMMLAQGSDDWFTDAGNWFWKKQGSPEQKRAAMLYLNSIKARKEFLLNLPSTAGLAIAIKEGILNEIPGSKVLVFSELTAQADRITMHTIHSNNNPKDNQRIMDEFNEGKIRILGSCRSLTLGLNLKGATHAIMESYIGSATQSKQKKGRLDRLATDDVAEMWIIRVEGTQCESWFDQMAKGFDLEDAEQINSLEILNNEYNFKKECFQL